MANTTPLACQDCIPERVRVTESCVNTADAMARTSELASRSILANVCCCDGGCHVCYRGVPSPLGALPRYAGEALNSP